MSRWPQTVDERFWSKVTGGDVDECWLWTATLNGSGYGHFYLEGRPHKAHRVAYEMMRAAIPAGLQLDHLCRVRACVNPWHLDPVTNEVNTERGELRRYRAAAKTHCPSGHSYAENTLRDSRGYQTCRQCNRRRCLANYYARKAATA